MTASQWNRRLKRWPGWVALGVVVVVMLVIGATRASGPQTPSDRVDSITARLACPICDGESVFESRNNASEDIRNRVTELVRANELGDDEIIGVIETRYGAQVLLVPRATGFDALVWVLPAMAFIGGLAALIVAFRRWRVDASSIPDPTESDRTLVAAALQEQHAAVHSGDMTEPGDEHQG
jgi:cytochrome c-type biogenesis protein CcmH